MMFTNIKVSEVSRKKLADGNLGMSYHKRLLEAESIDLTNNHKIINLGNGYSKILPIDTNKKIKR